MAEPEGDDSPVDDLSALRVEYKTVTGKNPSPKWDAGILRKKIEAANDGPPPAPPAPEIPASVAAPSVRVILLCDHVYLPEDPTAPGWEYSSTTARYEGVAEDGRRTKLDMHPTLAAFLQGRKQAEILD